MNKKKIIQHLCFVALLTTILVVCLPICSQPLDTPIVDSGAADGGNCDANSCSVPPANNKEFSDENWSFTVPGDTWTLTPPPSPELKVMAINQDLGCLLLFLKEPTTSDYASYAVDAIRSFAQDDVVINSVHQVMINSIKFVKVQVSTEDTVVWTWLTVKNGFGYGLSCGGDFNPEGGDTLHDLCQGVADTLEIQ